MQNDPKHWFRRYTIVMTGLLGIGTVGGTIFAPLTFRYGTQYLSSPYYRLYVIFGGIMLNMLIAFHMTISAFMFLYLIYATRGFTIKEFLKDWLLRQDGFRYGIILVLNSFSIYCYFYNALRPQTEVTMQMYFAFM
jgi:hypothetical protein